jgi:Tol biopolymer transport system component
MSKRWISLGFITIVILTITTTAVLIAKGYRFDRSTGTIKGTGIISVTSIPSGAVIYLNGELQTASNSTVNDLDPGTYHLKVSKDGFTSWEKDVSVEAEKVTLLNVTLFPSAPDLKPMTFSGVSSPILSPDGQRLAYSISAPNKSGLWVFDLSNRPFSFNREPLQVAIDNQNFSYSKSRYSWSPDSKSLLVTGNFTQGSTTKIVNYLLDIDRLNDNPNDISANIESIKAGWQNDQELKNKDLISRLPKSLGSQINIQSAKWSPDENGIMWSKDDKIFTYNLKKKTQSQTNKPASATWYPDSTHVITVENGGINIEDADLTNKVLIYAGAFNENFVYSWPDGSKLIILASFNTSTGNNLYSIDLR